MDRHNLLYIYIVHFIHLNILELFLFMRRSYDLWYDIMSDVSQIETGSVSCMLILFSINTVCYLDYYNEK
jgi:hypothetical protein